MCAAAANQPILVEQSFKDRNIQIRTAYLEHGCLWVAENIWKKWYLNHHGEEYIEDDFSDQDESDNDIEIEHTEDVPLWTRSFLSPSSYVAPEDDLQDSDDDLDSERRVAIDAPNGNSGRSQLGQMMAALNGRKIKDVFVETFLSCLFEKTEPFKENKNKLFKLKIQLINTNLDIHRIVQVST